MSALPVSAELALLGPVSAVPASDAWAPGADPAGPGAHAPAAAGPGTAPPPSAVRRLLSPAARRRRLLVGLGALLAVAVAAGVVLRPWQGGTPSGAGATKTAAAASASVQASPTGRTLKGHTDEVGTVAFSRDGSIIATGSRDGTVRLWRVADDTTFIVLSRHFGGIRAVAFAEKSIATVGYDGNLIRWSLEGQFEKLYGATDVEFIAFTGDGRYLVEGGKHGARLFDWTTANSRYPEDARAAMAGMAVQGNLLATVVRAADRKIEVHVFDLAAGTRLATLTGYNGVDGEVAFSPDGSMLAIGDEEGRLDIVTIATRQRRAVTIPNVKLLGVGALAFRPGNAHLAVVEQGRIYLVEVATGAMRPIGRHERLESLAFNPAGDLLATAGGVGLESGKVVNLWPV
jgi:WD40 repeat protein